MKRISLSEEELQDLKVSLKPLFGFKPVQYIKALYALLLLAALFVVFFLPGILKNGTWYNFTSSPAGASIVVDGHRLGATPGRFFIPKGNRSILLKSPYTVEWKDDIKVKGRVFASFFVKRNRDWHVFLESAISPESLEQWHQEISSWYASDEGYSSMLLPPVSQDLLYSVYRTASYRNSSPGNAEFLDKIPGFLESLLRNGAEKNAWDQWREGYSIYAARGRVLHPGNLLTAVLEASEFARSNPGIVELLKKHHGSVPSALSSPGTIPGRKEWFTVARTGSEPFVPDSSDPLRFVNVGSYGDGVSNYMVYAADREITKKWYSLFLAENPRWELSNLENLINDGLVDENYLSDWDEQDRQSQEVLSHISYYGAMEFCRWMEESYFQGFVEIRLPLEWEWESIALANAVKDLSSRPRNKTGPLKAGSFQKGNLDLYDMEGNLWEWCYNGFGKNDDFLLRTRSFRECSAEDSYNEAFPEYAVRGGSWANNPGEVSPGDRGSQPGDWCTPYIGFRPLLFSQTREK